MEAGAAAGSPRRRLRRISNTLIVLGVGVILYAGLILAWGDPVTWLWAHWQQRALTSEFHQSQQHFKIVTPPPDNSAALTLVRKDAILLQHSLKEGHAFGRLTIHRIGLSDVVVVQGTTAGFDADLSKGPGHYMNTSFPGMGSTVAIAGHRTTYLAPFRQIDSLHGGNEIKLEMPYATLDYRVEDTKVVDPTDFHILHRTPYQRLVLTACHPLYSASQRIVAFAKLDRVTSTALDGGGSG